ncbi:MAG: hypothetical protein AABY22_28665 [Nanoarchaeota archaeon]
MNNNLAPFVLIFLLGIVFGSVLVSLNTFERISAEKIQLIDLPINKEIYCDKGVDIREYGSHKVVYICLELVDGRCSGNGKYCFVKGGMK